MSGDSYYRAFRPSPREVAVELLKAFARGLLIVTLVAWNTVHVARLDYGAALLTGTALSLVWWGNSKQAASSMVAGARWAYALGAGLGTVCGMWLGR